VVGRWIAMYLMSIQFLYFEYLMSQTTSLIVVLAL
jgi:hypothetical protein